MFRDLADNNALFNLRLIPSRPQAIRKLILTSAHYPVIAKVLRLRRILRNELIEVTLVSVALSMSAFCKKSTTKYFMASHFLHSKSLMIVSKSVSPRISCSMLIGDSMPSFPFFCFLYMRTSRVEVRISRSCSIDFIDHCQGDVYNVVASYANWKNWCNKGSDWLLKFRRFPMHTN